MKDEELISRFLKETKVPEAEISREDIYKDIYEDIYKEFSEIQDRELNELKKQYQKRLNDLEEYYKELDKQEPDIYVNTDISSVEVAKGFVLGNFLWKLLCIVPKLVLGLILLVLMFI